MDAILLAPAAGPEFKLGPTTGSRDPFGDGDRVWVCGAALDPLSMGEVLARVESALDSGAQLNISVINAAKLVKMRADALLRESVLAGDLVLADGMPLVWLSRLRGRPLPERVAGIDLMFRLFELANRRRLRVFLLGADQETLTQVVAISRQRYPHMRLAGFRNGFFSDAQEEEVARQISESRPDILLVAMTSPKKEIFMKRWGSLFGAVVCHGVGGSFDVMAGRVRRAPHWMQRCGLEWLFRVLQEPHRLWKRYFFTNMAFLCLAVQFLLFKSGSGPSGSRSWQQGLPDLASAAIASRS
jgi:N-acetylglucosaminyldiphosphoundecaprenol N-acetyl-beta-D-mannosaminyltransferase